MVVAIVSQNVMVLICQLESDMATGEYFGSQRMFEYGYDQGLHPICLSSGSYCRQQEYCQ